MFVLDQPDLPHPVVVMAARPNQSAKVQGPAKERVMGVCSAASYRQPGKPSTADWSGGSLPNHWALMYFKDYEKRDISSTNMPSIRSVEIVTQPKHGRIEISKDAGDAEMLEYIPNPGYLGQDRVVYRVLVEGIPVKLVYHVHVTKDNLDTTSKHYCKEGNTWKISQSNATPPETPTSILDAGIASLLGLGGSSK